MDNFKLNRFVDVQRQTYQSALEELKSGRKDSHWLWYIFPQMKGLGVSEISRFFGMTGIEVVFAKLERSARAIFGYPDCLKFGLCLTSLNESRTRAVFLPWRWRSILRGGVVAGHWH